MDTARRYVDKGQLDKAVKEYLRVVAEEPSDVRVWLKIGDLYVKTGAKREATETYLRVANFYGEQGFYLKAVAVYKQILKLNPRLVEVNLKLAELYRQLGLMSDAMQHFERVAGHFHREGKTKEALATVRQLVDLDPDNVATRIKLAELYSKEGMVEDAVSEFSRACEHLRNSNREEDFLKVAERLLWHKTDNVALSRELAALYLRRNDARRALQKLQMCFKANSRDVDTLELLAKAFQSLGQQAKTVSVFKEMARVLDEDGKRERAEEIHRRILTLMPGDQDSQAYLGKQASQPQHAPAPAPPPQPRKRALTMSAFAGIPGVQDPLATGAVPLLDDHGGPAYLRGPSAPERGGERRPAGTPPSAPLAPPMATVVPADPHFESTLSGEEHSEEIAKILTETDVYVKYGLHDKAIEHLRRVFTLDPSNIEARERLKEILLSLGRGDEAVAELMRLAELTGARAPERAASYLRELLSVDRGHQPAFDLARRLGVRMPGAAVPAPPPRPRAQGPAPGMPPPVPGRPAPVPPRVDSELDAPEFFLEEDDEEHQESPDTAIITVDLSPEELEALDVALEARAARSGGRSKPQAQVRGESDPGSFFSTEIGSLPGDPGTGVGADAFGDELFDGATQVVSFEDASAFGADPVSDILEPFASPLPPDADVQPTHLMQGIPDLDDEAVEIVPGDAVLDPGLDTVDLRMGTTGRAAARAGSRSGVRIDDDLDEADFFMVQGLYSEAREVLSNLLQRHPNHPLLLAKLQEIDEIEHGGPGFVPAPAPRAPRAPTASPPAPRVEAESASRPTVMLEKPIDDEDADTHYDLGLAYKEMGLYQEAIQAFEKVSTVPGREVQCRLMIGLCYREQGEIVEAVNQFKVGLHAPGIFEQEQLSLYYEIGLTYQTMIGDAREAMYFYELIRKRTPSYRDVPERIAALESERGQQDGGLRQDISDEAEAAIDSLLAETDRSGRRGG